MDALKRLDGYAGQTTGELIGLAGEYRIDSILVAFEQALDQKEQRLGSGAINSEERAIQAVEALQREVNSGGFEQFFVNASNRYAAIIVPSLERIGCPLTAQTTQQAIAALKARDLRPATIEQAIRKPDDARDVTLIECDDVFLSYPENLDERLFEFIRAQSGAIQLR